MFVFNNNYLVYLYENKTIYLFYICNYKTVTYEVYYLNLQLEGLHVMVSCAVCIFETVESVHASEYNNCLVYRSVIININLCSICLQSRCLKYVYIRKLKLYSELAIIL